MVQMVQPHAGEPWGTATTVTITQMCQCELPASRRQPFYGSIDITKAKETKVAKHFDTTEIKNTALNTIQSKVDTVERALFDRAAARAKVDAEYGKAIADASLALDRALMEAIQNGLETEDISTHLPQYEDNLTTRMQELHELVQLDKVMEVA